MKTLPLHPPLRNPRWQILAKICEIFQFLLLQIKIPFIRTPYWKFFGTFRPQIRSIPGLSATYRGKDGQPLSKDDCRLPICNNGHPRLALRKRRKKRRGLSLEDPRSLWRLGLGNIRHYVVLFKHGLLRAMETEQSVRISGDSSCVEGNWEESSSLLWAYIKKRRMSRLTRLYSSYLFSTNLKMHDLVSVCWCFGFKLIPEFLPNAFLSLYLWKFSEPMEKNKKSFKKVLYSDEILSKEQSTNMNHDGHFGPSSTMAEEALKGSEQTKPFEAGPLGAKKEKLVEKTLKNGAVKNKAADSPPGTSTRNRLYQLSLVLAKVVKLLDLVYVCWCTGYKIKILCFDEESIKEQSENMNLIGQSEPNSTMVNTTLKGSAHVKPFEADPLGSKTEKGNNKAQIDTIMLALSHWISLLMYEWNTTSMFDKKLSMIDYTAIFDRANSLPRCTSVDKFSYCYHSICLLLIVMRISLKMWTGATYFEYFSGKTLGGCGIFAFTLVWKHKVIIEICRLAWFFLLANYGILSFMTAPPTVWLNHETAKNRNDVSWQICWKCNWIRIICCRIHVTRGLFDPYDHECKSRMPSKKRHGHAPCWACCLNIARR